LFVILDYFCILRIVDPTSCKDEGTKVTLFHEDAGQLPKVYFFVATSMFS